MEDLCKPTSSKSESYEFGVYGLSGTNGSSSRRFTLSSALLLLLLPMLAVLGYLYSEFGPLAIVALGVIALLVWGIVLIILVVKYLFFK
jgi:hypothetical protein